MTLSLKETQALSALADHLYGYLPASGAIFTFGEAAHEAGVGELWPGVGSVSKLPALTQLLENTLEYRRGHFCRLIEQIVRGGLKYRTRKGNPLTRPELEALNQLVVVVGFKIPELWDAAFLDSLPKPTPTPQSSGLPITVPDRKSEQDRRAALEELRSTFISLHALENRQKAGLQLEHLLNLLFAAFDLAPGKPFSVVGEQIDGSFVLDHEVYLLEAKWIRDRTDQKELYAFRGKIEGKASYTRGLFISISGFTEQAIAAVPRGKTPNFVMMDGAHLYRVLEGHLGLDVLLRQLVRHLGERGDPYLPINEVA